ncbi:MAG TPA: hypothetical protein VGG31_10215 [Candidatus Dormibacteraeota bacterium]
MSGTAGQREPPDTTTGELDDELTPLEDCSPDDVLDEEVLDEELEVDESVPDPVAEFEVAAEAVPGIVVALITANTPTPATAEIATPVVSRFSVRIAWSRARTLAWLAALVSTIRKLRDGP